MTGEEILKLRQTLGLTQQVLAHYLGVEKGTISRWERGNHRIAGENNRRLLRTLAERFAADPDAVREYFRRRDFSYPP